MHGTVGRGELDTVRLRQPKTLRWLLTAWLTVSPAAWAVAQMPPASVVVAPVQNRAVAAGRIFVGTVVPLRTSTVGSTVEARVVELLVDEGDRVEKDQPLARLRTRPLEITLAAAKAELSLRQHELAELENGSRPEEIKQAHARMLAAEALMEFASARLARAKTLRERKATSQNDLQERQSEADAAKNEHLDKKAAWELAVAGPRKEKIEQARAHLLTQQEEVRRLEDDIAEHTILAPFDGYVTKENTEVGQWIAKGDPVVELIDVEKLDVEAPVLENYVSQLRAGPQGTDATVEIGALPGRTWTAKVALIVPSADLHTRNFPVKVRLDESSGPDFELIRPGMFARVTLPVGGKKAALLVPKDALVLEEGSTMVWVVDPNPKAKPPEQTRAVVVQTGVSDGEFIEVRGQLKEGQLVVVEGNERIDPMRPVMILKVVRPAGDRSTSKAATRRTPRRAAPSKPAAADAAKMPAK